MAEYTRTSSAVAAEQLHTEVVGDSYNLKIDRLETSQDTEVSDTTVTLFTTSDLTAGEQTEFEATVDSHTP